MEINKLLETGSAALNFNDNIENAPIEMDLMETNPDDEEDIIFPEIQPELSLEESKSESNFEIINKDDTIENVEDSNDFISNAEYMQNMQQILDQNKELQERLTLVEGNLSTQY